VILVEVGDCLDVVSFQIYSAAHHSGWHGKLMICQYTCNR
jgi:hypothetical protein